MPNYTRAHVEGGTFFLTLVTHERTPLFDDHLNILQLRFALRQARRERPFDVVGAVVLPDHMHFIWRLPDDDADFSSRVGRMKVLFTRAFAERTGRPVSPSGRRHREQAVWQRRFWEHTIRDERDLGHHLDYIHYNPVKHGVARCPHAWSHSSFHRWVRSGEYAFDWYCACDGKSHKPPSFHVPE